MQHSVAVRNAMVNARESTIGTAPILRFYTGSAPANCAAANSGTLVAEMTLPSDWTGAASSGASAKSGTWEDASANADGTIGHYRLFASDGTTCHEQGTVTATGGGGDITVDNPAVVTGQKVTVTSYTYTMGNA